MEIELKLLLAQDAAPLFGEHPLLAAYSTTAPQLLALHDIYVDTPGLHLARHQAGLRVRQVGNNWLQTLKAGGDASGGLHRRHEWESAVAGPAPDIDALLALIKRRQPVHALLRQDEVNGALQTIFTTRIARTVWQLTTPEGDAIECVLDLGVIEANGATTPVCEVELELKAGRSASLFKLALALLQQVPLQLGQLNKAERGYQLAFPALAGAPKPVKAEALALDAAMSLEQAFVQIAGNCLQQISANADGVVDHAEEESLHQMRVGVRRLRSALGMLAPLLALPDDLQQELSWLSGALGAARDWDVLAGSTLASLEGEVEADMLASLVTAAQERARQAHADTGALLAGPRYTALMLGLQRWLHGREWRSGCTRRQLRRLDKTAPGFARRTLGKAQRRLLRRGKGLAQAAPEQRHRVRIAAKKARYATTFFGSLLRPRRVRAYERDLARLQDVLGGLNDLEVADGLLQTLAREPALAPQAGYVRGYLAARAQAGLARIDQAWRRVDGARLPY